MFFHDFLVLKKANDPFAQHLLSMMTTGEAILIGLGASWADGTDLPFMAYHLRHKHYELVSTCRALFDDMKGGAK